MGFTVLGCRAGLEVCKLSLRYCRHSFPVAAFPLFSPTSAASTAAAAAPIPTTTTTTNYHYHYYYYDYDDDEYYYHYYYYYTLRL